MNKIITVVRKPKELKAIVCRPRSEFLNQWDGNPADELNNFYESIDCALESSETEISYKNQCLLKSWDALRNIQKWDSETLFHVLVVLIETAPVFPIRCLKTS